MKKLVCVTIILAVINILITIFRILPVYAFTWYWNVFHESDNAYLYLNIKNWVEITLMLSLCTLSIITCVLFIRKLKTQKTFEAKEIDALKVV